MQTFVIVLTKNDPIRLKFSLGVDMKEHVVEEIIDCFEPYSRVIYVRAIEEKEAQRKVFDFMRLHGLTDWSELQDGILID